MSWRKGFHITLEHSPRLRVCADAMDHVLFTKIDRLSHRQIWVSEWNKTRGFGLIFRQTKAPSYVWIHRWRKEAQRVKPLTNYSPISEHLEKLPMWSVTSLDVLSTQTFPLRDSRKSVINVPFKAIRRNKIPSFYNFNDIFLLGFIQNHREKNWSIYGNLFKHDHQLCICTRPIELHVFFPDHTLKPLLILHYSFQLFIPIKNQQEIDTGIKSNLNCSSYLKLNLKLLALFV